jgi:ABC-type lipoprotein export system ATPase subunit
MKTVYDPKGSIWRKWDLHVHSPASYNYKGTYEQFIEQIEKSDCSVVGINDYCSVEGYKQFKIKNPDSSKVVFPVVEFRMHNALLDKNLKGGKRINFHIIFSNEIDIEDIENFLKSLTVNKTQISSRYSDSQFLYEKVSVDFKDIKERLEANQTFKDKYLIWMPYDEYGGIDDIDPVNDQWFKQNLINDAHIIGSSNKKQVDFFLWNDGKTKEEKFREWFTDKKPCAKGSDSHEHAYPIGSLRDDLSKPTDKYCWIKADPTFEGLKQIVNEPEDRIFIGNTPPKLIDTENNKSHYIDSIILKPVDNNRSNPWFDNKIQINPGLVAIIGKKGSGKSALVDSIALVGKSHADPATYSFLRDDKFKKKGLAKQYGATLIWNDGVSINSNLNDQVSLDTEPEQVKYLPQKFVENVCNEVGINLFQQEIDKVIFSYVPEESREDTTNLKDLIKLKTDLIDSSIDGLRQKLSKQNELICALEEKKLPSYLSSLRRKLEEKRRELNNLIKPKKVAEPKSKPSKEIEKKISVLNSELEEVEKLIDDNQKKLKEVNQHITKVQNLKIALGSLKKQFDEFFTNYQADLTLLEIDYKKLITVKINNTVLSKKQGALNSQKDKLNTLLSPEGDDKTSLVVKKENILANLKKIHEGLDKENNAYQEYQKALKEYQDKKKLIEGSKDDTSLKTINSLEQEIEYVTNNLDKETETAYQKRDQIVSQIYDELIKKISFFKEIYSPLGKIISDKKAKQKKTGSVLDFDVGIVFDKIKFPIDFLSFIDQSRDGSFQGKAEGSERLKEIIRSSNLKTKEGIKDFIKELVSCLRFDKSEKNHPPKSLDDQLIRGDGKKLSFYDYLYGLNYLEVKYTITFNDKDLNENEFSPGEIGALLLIFYLLIDKDKIPLIIDQPEENLDNESVFTLLVPYIKQAKKERQIIIVTHNPNLAVVCDAEQVISANMDKHTNEIRYTLGSIENPTTNKKILDVLEGTLPAFQKRDHKYLKK